MESENSTGGDLIKDTIYEGDESPRLRELVIKARSARCRARFPVPVILFQGKFICRSATLSGGPEIYSRSGFDYFFAGESTIGEQNQDDNDQNNLNNPCNNWVLCDQVRKDDIRLLKSLSVGTIVDFMVEKKKVKFGLNVTSSEKVDKEKRYSQFTILSLPYPGCEFFKEFRDQNYSAENLYYNWSQTHVDAEIIVPQDSITDRVPVKWKDYKKWNLLSLTGNYLLLLLRYTFDSSSGMLIHCISGWDRTPLFTSLLRICLWADGAIHKSLTPIQLLYFTIAYDWLLFGHDLQDRKNKGEDIFYFCFHFLKYLMGDEYSVPNRCKGKVTGGSNNMLRSVEDYVQCDGGDLDGGEMIMCSQGSTHSLNSSWSSISSKSQEINASQSEDTNMSGGIWIGDGTQSQLSSSSSNSAGSTLTDFTDTQKILMAKMSQATSTSPVAVPTRTSFRQRNESTSSLSIGSWQYVTSTGSLRSSGSSNSRSSGPDTAVTDSTATVTEVSPEGCFIKRKQSDDHSQCGSSCAMRRERLEQIRKLFANCYCQSIGHNLKDGSESSGLSNIIGNLAGKIYQKT
ncbi:Myotubularin- protein 14 [Homalodisca vitripennis]|nr:Myotubularin- protein 14 [Homalodisca vitripennis]